MESIKSFFPKFEQNKLLEIDFKVLALLGFMPQRMVNFRSFFIFTLSLLLEVLPEFYFIVHHINDVQRVFMCLHEFVSLLVYVLKIFVFFIHRRNLVALIGDLKQEWSDSFIDASAQWSRVGHDLEKLIFKTTRNFYAFVFTSGAFYFTIPIVVHFLFLGADVEPWPVPVQVYYGFEFSEHWLAYIGFIFVTIPHMLLVTLAFYGIDIFFVNILIFCTSYMKYIQCEVEQLRDDLNSFLEDGEVIRKRVCKIVRIHGKGIKLAEDLEKTLNVLMLVLYSVNTMVLCFLFFEFHILLNDFINLLKVLIFFGVVQTLLILFSYFGTKLMEESQAVGTAVYDLPWYNINDCSTRRSLMLTILRAHRPVNITSGKFYPVNLESYYDALTKAFSYCTVLLNVL